jgi:hypothetical protein
MGFSAAICVGAKQVHVSRNSLYFCSVGARFEFRLVIDRVLGECELQGWYFDEAVIISFQISSSSCLTSLLQLTLYRWREGNHQTKGGLDILNVTLKHLDGDITSEVRLVERVGLS